MYSSRLDRLLRMAVEEDLEHGDVTTAALVDPDRLGQAVVFGREPFVLSGSQPFERIFQLVDPRVRVECYFQDGEKIQEDIVTLKLTGPVASILTLERTALNLLQRLCGVATLTRKMVEAVAGTRCRILDTRKTTPLWRALEKEAVRHGGGTNHRFGLSDGVLIKDNHIAVAGGIRQAIEEARKKVPHLLKIEIEVESLEQFDEALDAGAEIILIDNFSPIMMREAVLRNRGRALLEASGGVTLETVRTIAETGVDFVSCGAVTHSARAIDLSMEITSS